MSENKILNNMTTSVEGQELVIERIFDAPRELLFKTYSDAEHLANWWGPSGWQTENKRFEFEPNGVWHYCMRCTDKNQGDFYGQESWGKAVYKEIDAPEKIVYTDVFSDEEGNVNKDLPEVLVTLIFIEQGNKTKLVIRSRFESVEELQKVKDMGVVEGMSSQFECLDSYLKKIQ